MDAYELLDDDDDLEVLDALLMEADEDEDEGSKVKQPRAVCRRPNYWDSEWGRLLLSGKCGDRSTREGKRFRRRFRGSYVWVMDLVEFAHKQLGFSRKERAKGRRVPPPCYGSGCGSGNGCGSGCGSDCGCGSGSGNGCSSGNGSGRGCGSGNGSGSGSGSGSKWQGLLQWLWPWQCQ